MNDNAIKNYAIWARRELMSEVGKRCAWWGIAEGAQDGVESVDGRVLSRHERAQRAELLRMAKDDGFDQLVERAAYTWFNRLLAIRFMELNDRLPSHVRVLSAEDGSFKPQCLREALDLPLEALDKVEAARLVQAGDDEALFRAVFLAQCAELAECMPAVFEPVGSAMELLLPTGLLRADSVVGRLVADIPEGDWREGVEIVGWMYQYYVSERKDEVFAGFKKGRKAERDAIAPATQLFTPHWIVRYLTENSLGRLWMLNNPGSGLVERMPYYVRPDGEHEAGFRRVSSPEEVTVVDPACGSGHILVYAFELLAAMYGEAGYSNRDAARLILEENLAGLEIDPRAAAMASFALTMKACELDPRFLRRGVVPRITVLGRVELEPEELALCPNVAGRKPLLDAAAHLDECGSLFQPEAGDLAAIERDLASLAGDDSLFAGSAREKLESLLEDLRPFTARYDVVVANPPYMGSNNMGKWISEWVTERYPDSKRDLCTCFIERGFGMLTKTGYSAMVTMESWMFLGSFEAMRKSILENHSIAAMVYMNHMVMRIAFNTCATVFRNQRTSAPGLYTKVEYSDLNDEGVPFEFPIKRHAPKRKEGDLEALANPECGWFYKTDASRFDVIPGTPIAYWASEAMLNAFALGKPFGVIGKPSAGITTGNNARFIHFWWEADLKRIAFKVHSMNERPAWARWFPCNKGGEYRKWYGNRENIMAMDDESIHAMEKQPGYRPVNLELQFAQSISWSDITSGLNSFRANGECCLFDHVGISAFPESHLFTFLLGLVNSSVCHSMLRVLAPTMHCNAGDISKMPVVACCPQNPAGKAVESCISLSRVDWDSSETSWNFTKHSLV